VVSAELDLSEGALILLKTRRTPPRIQGPVGTTTTGLGRLDRLLVDARGHALPAFPFDLGGTQDRVGLRRWLVLDVPSGVDLSNLVEELRSSPDVLPETILVEDPGWFRVRARGSWPTPLLDPRPDREIVSVAARSTGAGVHSGQLPEVLRAVRAPEAWKRSEGASVGIAVVDTGVDGNHMATAMLFRLKPDERPGHDGDGNGVPGDDVGINVAHLAVARRGGPPFLGLGLRGISDWDGAGTARAKRGLGHGTALAAIAAGSASPGRFPGVAPAAWILPVDVQENLAIAAGRAGTPDPRMREALVDTEGGRLRSPLWSRAAGVVYAVTEGVRVLTCAWPPEIPAHRILHDVLIFAEDNCVLPVCALDPPMPGPSPALVRWRRTWLRAHGGGAGEIVDGWTGEVLSDFAERPLRATLLVGGADVDGRPVVGGKGTDPDLYAPETSRSAESSPRNDGTPSLDARVVPYLGPAVASGLVAGVAALVTAARPDLDPVEVRHAILGGASRRGGRPWLDAAGSVRKAEDLPAGRCEPLDARRARARQTADQPFWRRIRVDASRPDPRRQPKPPPSEHWP
jgi:subtilisin family serine protease